MNSQYTITKTNFIHFIRCHKLLWLDKNKKTLKNKPTVAEQLNIEEGYLIGDMATKHQSYSNGELVKTLKYKESLLETNKLLRTKKNLYEPAFAYNHLDLNLFLRVDILEYISSKKYNLIEVKSSSQYQEIHLWDIAFQIYVLEKCGIDIEKINLMKPSKGFKRENDVIIEEFFELEEVTKLVKKKYVPKVEKVLNKIYKTLSNQREPTKILGSHCKNPWNCPFKNYCYRNINSDSVEKLSRLSSEKRALFRKEKIKYIKDIEYNKDKLIEQYNKKRKRKLLSEKQKIQLEVALTEKPFIDKNGIENFLNNLEYPLYHLDFEAYNKTVPPYIGMKPHQFLTFQASLHKEFKNGKLEHFEFLQERKQVDPRENMIKFLLDNIGKKGSVVVYNKNFEKSRIKELAKDFPMYEKELYNIIDRMIDLEVPFKKYYYHHDFEGSSSIKKVLPVMVPELSYDRLLIQNGSDAQAIYRKLLNKHYHTKGLDGKLYRGKTFRKMKKGLLNYCALDTMAMVMLLRELFKLVKEEL